MICGGYDEDFCWRRPMVAERQSKSIAVIDGIWCHVEDDPTISKYVF
ncbi:hypothetical protein AALP_AA8G317100 [Arabis alpina]|uniref:Uncharacterized protein n=1 Tax=Arabis alpina TaxID=50452 RepID=A0A087GAR9_ARAAL|nr:hypothetical protein AALP_AA8G317100 [Arabis alpina]